MSKQNQRAPREEEVREAIIELEISKFEFPPMQDLLVVGRDSPLGTRAAKRLSLTLAPDQYEFIQISDSTISCLLIRKSLLKMIERQRLLKIILEEAKRVMGKEDIMKMKLNISLRMVKKLKI